MTPLSVSPIALLLFGALMFLLGLTATRLVSLARARGKSGRSATVTETIATPDTGVREAPDIALMEAVAQERRQIYSDLHDDLGAKLLELVYRAEPAEMSELARHALMDLRDVVSRTRGEPGTLLQVLGEIAQEAERRLAHADIALDWQQEGFADAELNPGQCLQLFRIVREAVSNVIRHAQAQKLRIRVVRHIDAVRMELSDDGTGGGRVHSGTGVNSMRERAEKLAGDITWRGATAGGTRVILSFPLGRSG